MLRRVAILALVVIAHNGDAAAEPLAAPGDIVLRNDLQLLNDNGLTNIPITAWPIAFGDVNVAIESLDPARLTDDVADALHRTKERVARELNISEVSFRVGAAAAHNPLVIRSFENTPREDAQLDGAMSWLGERFAVNLAVQVVDDPFDGDEVRFDGTYVGVALGNWILTAGWQDRWYGPGRDGSLILSNNARPSPGVGLQRNTSTPFETKWLSWLGPWTLATFMTQLDDDRATEDTLLFGIRGSFRPVSGLEIGLSRTAQWCGDGRPCDGETFLNLLSGKDNRGVNVDPADEPGNQLGGFDIRWSLPADIPVAAYMQWIGEDGRPSGGLVGSWSRQIGVEFWGRVGTLSHRTHFEVADTMCAEGGFGFGGDKPNCTYEHPLYLTGYRYKGRSLGHSADADSLAYSFGSTLIQSDGHTWNLVLRFMEINRLGDPKPTHTLTPTPQEYIDVYVTHRRETAIGVFYAGLGVHRLDDELSNRSENDASAFLTWMSQ